MTMTTAGARLGQNPVLTGLLTAPVAQSSFIAEKLFPRLPNALRGMTLAAMGDEATRNYDTRRAPGTSTKQVNISWSGKTFTVKQYSVDVPIPREILQEVDTASHLNVDAHLDVSRIAISTGLQVLNTGYELEAANLALNPANYAGNSLNITGGDKWSAPTGKPVTQILQASEAIRQKTGRRPNLLTLSASALLAISLNPEVKSYLPDTLLGSVTIDQLKTIFKVAEIVVGESVVKNGDDVTDIWGNNAVLAYVPNMAAGMALGEPAFGFTNVLEGHPFAEQPRYDATLKSWVFGSTFERECNIVTPGAGFLIQNPA